MKDAAGLGYNVAILPIMNCVTMKKLLLLLVLCLPIPSLQASAETPEVLATLHPLTLLAASVVPTTQLQVLLPAGTDPHHFSLKPSDIDQLQEADIILWAGHKAEPYLSGFVRRWPEKNWIDVSQFATADQPDDMHYWLSLSVMKKAQQQLAKVFGKTSATFEAEMRQAEQEIQQLLTPVQSQGFLVYHRAYDHWVAENQLNQLGSFTLHPEQKPGLRTLSHLRNLIREKQVACIFYEPGVAVEIIRDFAGNDSVRLQELDPLGTGITVASDSYATFMVQLARDAAACLNQSSPADAG